MAPLSSRFSALLRLAIGARGHVVLTAYRIVAVHVSPTCSISFRMSRSEFHYLIRPLSAVGLTTLLSPPFISERPCVAFALLGLRPAYSSKLTDVFFARILPFSSLSTPHPSQGLGVRLRLRHRPALVSPLGKWAWGRPGSGFGLGQDQRKTRSHS
jgi:hypothetical protein